MTASTAPSERGDVGAERFLPGPALGEVESRVLDAALALVARWGVGKTSLADVAKEAGCARATVYRAFPGGKQHLFQALAGREIGAYTQAVLEALDAAEDLEEALTMGLVVASRLLRDHDAARFIVEHEPELLLPLLGFKRVDVVYRHTAALLGPSLERFLAPDRAAWASEWAARMLLNYQFNPSDRLDLSDVDATRRHVRQFLLPALDQSAFPQGAVS